MTFNHTMAGTITSRNYRTSFCRIGWAANSPSGTIADSDTFTFDNLGRMLTAVSGRYTNTVTMTYDSYGRLKDESLTLAGQTYTVTRAYDTRSRLTQLTYPNGSIVQRTYTTRSQLHTVRYLGTTVDTRTYNDGGRLGTSTYANGAVVSFAYRNDNLPTSIATTHCRGSLRDPILLPGSKCTPAARHCRGSLRDPILLPGSNYRPAARHCRGSLRDPILLPGSKCTPATRHCRGSLRDPILLPGSNDRPAARHCRGSLRDPILVRGANHYTSTGYDDEDRLQTWNRTNGTLNQAWTLSAVGNWNNFTSAGSTWNRTHSNAHEFTGFTGASTGTLAYDVKGNQTSRPSTLSAPALNLDWNFDNQLRGADTNGSAGSLEVTFEYDALGRRVSRSHSSGNVVYVHAGQQVIADYARGAVTSSPTYRYVYADYVDEPILRHTGTATTLPTTGDNALYYHRNQQYSIIGLTNAAGTLVERYSYTAYGTLGIYDASGTVRTTSTYANRYTYTGREYDADLNLYHFRARWYDPSTGGFISRDPLGYVDGMSLYRGYFGVKDVDPNGRLRVADERGPGLKHMPGEYDPLDYGRNSIYYDHPKMDFSLCERLFDNCISLRAGLCNYTFKHNAEQLKKCLETTRRECREARVHCLRREVDRQTPNPAPATFIGCMIECNGWKPCERECGHRYRNMFNKCPKERPDPGVPDSRGNVWRRDSPNGETAFHGGYQCFRSEKFQCCYDEDNVLVTTGRHQGTYDYVAVSGDYLGFFYLSTWEHTIADVLPHRIDRNCYYDGLTEVY
ncbi:MAG: RHS repeat-associated core domain-containing protein [Planctomycetaceae bacterium]|nr:RHS repeat-associated core domain-containing protein [Planctomycetaceae bacterium]